MGISRPTCFFSASGPEAPIGGVAEAANLEVLGALGASGSTVSGLLVLFGAGAPQGRFTGDEPCIPSRSPEDWSYPHHDK